MFCVILRKYSFNFEKMFKYFPRKENEKVKETKNIKRKFCAKYNTDIFKKTKTAIRKPKGNTNLKNVKRSGKPR